MNKRPNKLVFRLAFNRTLSKFPVGGRHIVYTGNKTKVHRDMNGSKTKKVHRDMNESKINT